MGVAVLYVDFDNFKLVNDTLGHGAGDELLRDMVDRLREATRETDLVARHGGDEFLILLADLRRGRRPPATAWCWPSWSPSRIHDSLQRPFQLGDTEFYVSASIGISVYPAGRARRALAAEHADQAMYREQEDGPRRVRGIRARHGDAASARCRSRRSCAGPSSEKQWVLHYQPIVDLVSGQHRRGRGAAALAGPRQAASFAPASSSRSRRRWA